MSLTLFDCATAPSPRRARILLGAKRITHHTVQVDLRSAMALEADRTVRCARTEDHHEAVQAFLHKRKPSFSGRRRRTAF